MHYFYTAVLLLISLTTIAQNSLLNLTDKNDFVIIPEVDTSDLTLNTAKQITIEARILLKDTTGYVAIANKHWCYARGGGYHFGVRNGCLTFVWTESGHCDYHASIITLKPLIKQNRWYHVAATFDNGKVKLFINGKEKKSIQKGNINGINMNNEPTLLGAYRRLNGDYCSFFDGYIDNFRVWNVNKSTKDIRKSKKKASPKSKNNLLVSLNFNRGDFRNTGSHPSIPICNDKNSNDKQAALLSIEE